jgi:hypothetical protein
MEENTQLTMDLGQYTQAKEEIKNDLAGIVKSFVRVGWQLWRINSSEAYKQDGYATIAEFAKAEYGMTPSGVSRFIEVYEKYSVDGDTPELKEEYREYNFSQLTEMLQIPEESRAMFLPEAKRESIRDYKAYTKENENDPDRLLNWMKEPKDEEGKAIVYFFKFDKERMNAFFGSRAYAEGDIKELSEILNPSGNMHFRYKTVFMMFYNFEKGIMVNLFGQSPRPVKWEDFINRVKELFAHEGDEPITWDSCFGQKEQAAADPEQPAEEAEQAATETVNTDPAQDEQLPGQDSIENHPEFMPKPVIDEQSADQTVKDTDVEVQAVPDEINPHQVIAPAQKQELTEEQKYDAEQRKIDRETKKKLQEMEDEEKMSHLPSDEGPKVHSIKLASNYYDDITSEKKTFELRKNDRDYKVGHVLELLEFADGRHTGRIIHADIVYMLEDYTGLEDGYCILGIKVTDFTE